ncbi:MAG TPA: TadE/TadG family type IV pilus assembly protein [Clostridiales bacterium]|nr:TadE/TadG family type IV pilus assembly protein [Clostridiales bacterium]
MIYIVNIHVIREIISMIHKLVKNNVYKNKNSRFNIKDKGSVTLEAAIAIPVFISVIMSISLFIKVIYTHEIIQNAISHTANELASLSYIYHASGIEGLHNEILEKFKDIPDIHIEVDSSTDIPAEFDIPPELREILYNVLKGIYEDSFNQLCIPIARLCSKKYLTTYEVKDPDNRLRMLDIIDGFKGLDFSMSEFFEEDDNIDIVVRYKVKIPAPVRIFPSICIIQKASVRAWLGGDEIIEKDEKGEDDIWSLDNFSRGRKIRELYGANLPFNLPVIARFEKGTATMIKSMDLTADSYQEPELVSKKVELYINELLGYQGQEVPWGKDQIIIKPGDIKVRQLILVIPGNPIEPKVINTLEECRLKAGTEGIILKIEKYGYKKNEKAEQKENAEEKDETE